MRLAACLVSRGLRSMVSSCKASKGKIVVLQMNHTCFCFGASNSSCASSQCER